MTLNKTIAQVLPPTIKAEVIKPIKQKRTWNGLAVSSDGDFYIVDSEDKVHKKSKNSPIFIPI